MNSKKKNANITKFSDNIQNNIHQWTLKLMLRNIHLDAADARTDVDEEEGEDRVDVNFDELIAGIPEPLVDESFVGEILQQEVAALYQAFHLIFLVNSGHQEFMKILSSY